MSHDQIKDLEDLAKDAAYIQWMNHFTEHVSSALKGCSAWHCVNRPYSITNYALHAALKVAVDAMVDMGCDPDEIAQIVKAELADMSEMMDEYPAARREIVKGSKYDRTRAGK